MTMSLTPLFYLAHAGVCCGGFWLLRRLRAAGRLEQAPGRGLFVAATVVGLFMLAIAEPLRGPFQDFVEAYYSGGASIVAGAWGAGELFRNDVHGFVNVPIVGVLFVPFALLPSRVAAFLFLGLGVGAVVVTWRVLVRLGGLDWYRASLLALLMLANGPLMNSLKEGNTSHFALLAMVLAIACLRRGEQYRAGVLLGCAAVFKLPLILFGVWLFLRGRFRAALGGACVLGATAALSILVFGWDVHVIWYERFVASASRQPIAAFNVQSFPALIARLLSPEVICDWRGVTLSRGARLLASACGFALIAAAALSALWPRLVRKIRSNVVTPVQFELEFALVALLACCTSPLAWSHYYCWALIPLALALAHADALSRLGPAVARRPLWLLAGALLSLPVAWPWCAPGGPLRLPYTLFVSHYLLGGTLLVGLLAVWRAAGPVDGVIASERA